MSKLLRRTLAAVSLAIVLYAFAVLWFGARQVGDALDGYAWWTLVAGLALSSVNYLLRFWKWELCLGWLGVREPGEGNAPELGLGRSLQIYLAGLSMSVTPGKIGEVLRSWLLKASDGVAFGRTAPIVVADRMTDLIALVILSLVGITEFRQYLPHVIVTLVLVGLGLVVLGNRQLSRGLLNLLGRLPGLGGLAERGQVLVESAADLLAIRRVLVLTVISVVGWGMECAGYWLILTGFPGVEASLALCTFLWATTTIVGAISFLPGGLGATEASLGVLAAQLAIGVDPGVALASTLLIRGATLWYGEVVGGVALAAFMRDPALRRRTEQLESEAAVAREGEGANARAP